MTKELFYQELESLVLSVAKFKTHKNRKVFFGQVKKLIEDFATPNDLYRAGSKDIVRPNPNGRGTGYVVMTEGDSARGDEIRKQTQEKKNANN